LCCLPLHAALRSPLRLDELNVKGFYRRALVHTEYLKTELAKEERGEFWVTEKAWAWHKKAEEDLKTAFELADEDDTKLLKRAEVGLRRAEKTLKKYQREYEKEQKVLYKKKIMEPIDRKNKQLREKEIAAAARRVDQEEEDLPDLE